MDVGHDFAATVGPGPVDVPALFKAEVISGLRKMLLGGRLSPSRAEEVMDAVRASEFTEYPLDPFVDRVWQLRDNVSVYDAWYIALAESLDTELITTDAHLAAADGPRCVIRYLGRPGSAA